ncbi:unnamed protein product [Trichogramma brassicae]|uniref:Reverse transcriptase Ty1/copia-type domain-containing protein n=1 Tax=Trichogramma brassicae TaxID=86971 RepID=A0A6H5J4J0_9HYME|nr:unnamed protein product [Trichogramma brassicae]
MNSNSLDEAPSDNCPTTNASSSDGPDESENVVRVVPIEDTKANEPYEGRVTRSRSKRLAQLTDPESTMIACEVDMKEALSGPDKAAWFDAMRDEVKSLVNNDTWTVVEKPHSAKLIGCRTVLRNKYNPDGTICRRKARLVAQGFSQIPGIDYFETFAPVARLDSLRTLAALASQHKLKIFQFDVVTAYLHGEVDTTLHMQIPKMLPEILESIIATENDQVTVDKAKIMLDDLKKNNKSACKLNKALYGLRQAGRRWYEKINGVLKQLGLRPTSCDSCLYTDSRDKLTFMLLYVDDILLVSRNIARVAEIKKGLAASFDLKDMGLAKYCLGIEIEQSNSSVSLCQSGFIKEILARFDMLDCKPVSTPLATGLKLERCKDLTPKSFPYRELIGALMYLSVGTRPDITHAVSYLSQFNSCHDNTHWTAAKHVLRYLKGTSNMKLVYSRDEKGLKGFADADWG